MVDMTLKELRALAKQAGLKGYSKLSKQELQVKLGGETAKAIASKPDAPKASALKPARNSTAVGATASTTSKTKPLPPSKPALPPAERPPAPVDPGRAWWRPPGEALDANTASANEQRIESAKYALAPGGAVPSVGSGDLGEDIDALPTLRRSALVLLPQKPGVVHAYWALAPGAVSSPTLQLRLCRDLNGTLDVQQEATVSAARGHWYFHVAESLANHEVVIQLGYYDGGRFVSAVDRGMARMPSLYASSRTDRWWWISEADFARMYLRGGGAVRGRALGWAGSIGSPSGQVERGEQQLAWPGAVTSS